MSNHINLECGLDVRGGFLNICSWPSLQQIKDVPEKTEFAIGSYKNLDPIVKDETVEEIIFTPAFNILTPSEITTIIPHWCKKMVKGGILKGHLVDIKRVGKAAYMGSITLQEIDALLFGPSHEHNCVIDSMVFQNVIKELGFNLESVSIFQYHTTIEASKK